MAGLYYQPQGLLGAPMSSGLLGRDPMNYDMPPEGAVYADPNNPSMTDKVMGGLAMMPVAIAEGVWEGFKTPYKAYTEGMTQDEMIGASSVFGPLGGMVALGGLGRAGLNGAKPGGELGIFGGKLAKTADHAALAKAEKMAAEGVDRGAIWNETGWFQGVDGKWRFEIPDQASSYYGAEMKPKEYQTQNYSITGAEGAARDVLSHDALYQAYPDLADMPVAKTFYDNGQHGVYHDPGPSGQSLESIGLNMDTPGFSGRSTMLHEMQHAVQQREGFSRGGISRYLEGTYPNPQAAVYEKALKTDPRLAEYRRLSSSPEYKADIDALNRIWEEKYKNRFDEMMAAGRTDFHKQKPEMDALLAKAKAEESKLPTMARVNELGESLLADKIPLNKPADFLSGDTAYKRLAGETEARNVQKRMDMYDRATPPWETQDVPDAEQIVRMSLDGPAMSTSDPVTPPGIKAYHGSPHDFDKFSMEKIGTGEGAQAFGHGLYLAENKGVAEGYRSRLAGDVSTIGDMAVNTTRNPSDAVNAWMASSTGLPDDLRAAVAQKLNSRMSAKEILDDLSVDFYGEYNDQVGKILKSNPGRLYEVSIAAHPDEFLDWDKPLSEQPEKVRNTVHDLFKSGALDGKDKRASGAYADPKFREHLDTMTGERIRDLLAAYRTAGQAYSGQFPMLKGGKKAQADAANLLREKGIKGIRYKDAGSRGAAEGGTSNFVVFDAEIISILKKYGIAGLIAAGMGEEVAKGIAAQYGLKDAEVY